MVPTFLRTGFAAALVSLAASPALANPELSTGAVMTPEAQSSMTPDQALDRLRAGNERYVAGVLTQQDVRAEVAATASGQYPFAIVLSCLDSRVPVEQAFDQGIGDLFVGRVAGNVVDDHMLGSMEFGAAVAGARLVVVMGHTACGAVKGACDAVDVGHIGDLVETIAPSVAAVTPEGETCDSSNAELVDDVAEHTVGRTVQEIRERSEILSGLEAEGTIRIVGAMYDLSTGRVTFHDDL